MLKSIKNIEEWKYWKYLMENTRNSFKIIGGQLFLKCWTLLNNTESHWKILIESIANMELLKKYWNLFVNVLKYILEYLTHSWKYWALLKIIGNTEDSIRLKMRGRARVAFWFGKLFQFSPGLFCSRDAGRVKMRGWGHVAFCFLERFGFGISWSGELI